MVAPTVVGDRARTADDAAEQRGEFLERGKRFGGTDAATARHDDGRGGERDARDALHAIDDEGVQHGVIECDVVHLRRSRNG